MKSTSTRTRVQKRRRTRRSVPAEVRTFRPDRSGRLVKAGGGNPTPSTRRIIRPFRPFPQAWIDQTRCGQRLDDRRFYRWSAESGRDFGRSFPSHAPHSESRGQRSLLYIRAKALRYRPPPQTCCRNQATTLSAYLAFLLSTTAPTQRGTGEPDGP